MNNAILYIFGKEFPENPRGKGLVIVRGEIGKIDGKPIRVTKKTAAEIEEWIKELDNLELNANP